MDTQTTGWIAKLRLAAIGTSVIWAGSVLSYGFGYLGSSAGGFAAILVGLGLLVALVLPIGLIWAVLWLLNREAHQQADGLTLDARITELETRLAAVEAAKDARGDVIAAPPADPPMPVPPTPPKVPAPSPEPAPPAEEGQPPAAAPVAAPMPAEADDQPLLPFSGEDSLTLSREETIRALNFPENPQDQVGFEILARALARHDLARLLQASEDCLNFMAHAGLYMDDLLPAPATADDWRTFAKGGRARADLLPITGITDAAALDTVRDAMRADPVFRDAALHFQRRFDHMLSEFAPTASDNELLDLIDTRTGRAFILLAQVSGSLDRP